MTKVSLREYFEAILDEKQKTLDKAFSAQQEALGLASRTLELRLEKLNELRQEVTQDRGNYVTKEQYETKQEGLERALTNRIEVNLDRIVALERNQSTTTGKGLGLSTAWGIALGLIGGLATIVSMIYLFISVTGK